MIELLLALAGEPAAVQERPAPPLKVVNTAFIVSNTSAPFDGNIRVVVQNTGAEADTLVAVSTPLGEALEFRTDGDVFSSQAPVSLPISLPPPVGEKPSYLPLIVRVRGLERGDYWSTGTSVTLRFAVAGEMVVPLTQSVPAPSAAR